MIDTRVRGGKKTRIKGREYDPYAKIDWGKAPQLFEHIDFKKQDNTQYPSIGDVLRVVAAAGIVGLVFVFPGAVMGLAPFVIGKRSYSSWKTKAVFHRLKKQRWVTIKEQADGATTVTITQRGMRHALTYQLDRMEIKKPKQWDKKWRLVIFDIPERFRKLRDLFRMRLKQLGLFPLQESVYISPYRCFEEVEFLRELYGVTFSVQYLLVEKVEDDSFLRGHFGLG